MYWQQTIQSYVGQPAFDNEQKSLKFLLEIMTLVSSVNNIGSDTEFILKQRPLENSMFQCTPVREKKILVVLRGFTSTFWFLSVKQDLNQSSHTPPFP